jgi:hypothetical protein
MGKGPNDGHKPRKGCHCDDCVFNRMQSLLARYRDALLWYADDKHWTLMYLEGPHGDYGIRAKEALEFKDD